MGGSWDTDGRSMMLAQCRCLGLYFSPINFYFCYDSDDNCQYMLAEVSNTPWRERHYYLLNFSEELKVKKAFHVSPFMGMDMDYHWKISPPDKRVRVHIENHQQEKVFDATMALIRQPLEAKQLLSTLLSIPSMTLKIVLSIYWQALKLFIGKVPFVAHPNTSQKS